MTEKYKTIIKLTSFATLQPTKSIIKNSRSDWFSKANTLVWAEPCAQWAELKMLSFWAGGISSFPPCAREYRLLRRLVNFIKLQQAYIFQRFISLPEQYVLKHGYPAYITSVGWLGYDQEKIRNLCEKALAEGWTR